MKRKHIDDLGIPYNRTMQGLLSDEKDKRLEKWAKTKSEYGFDERETWDITSAFEMWLYERLMMYNDINIVDTTTHTFKFKGEILTFQNCIDKMILGLKLNLTNDYDEMNNMDKVVVDDVKHLFVLVYHHLWW